MLGVFLSLALFLFSLMMLYWIHFVGRGIVGFDMTSLSMWMTIFEKLIRNPSTFILSLHGPMLIGVFIGPASLVMLLKSLRLALRRKPTVTMIRMTRAERRAARLTLQEAESDAGDAADDTEDLVDPEKENLIAAAAKAQQARGGKRAEDSEATRRDAEQLQAAEAARQEALARESAEAERKRAEADERREAAKAEREEKRRLKAEAKAKRAAAKAEEPKLGDRLRGILAGVAGPAAALFAKLRAMRKTEEPSGSAVLLKERFVGIRAGVIAALRRDGGGASPLPSVRGDAANRSDVVLDGDENGKEGSMPNVPMDEEDDIPVAVRLLEWYSVWTQAGPGGRSEKMISEARTIDSLLTPQVQDEITSLYGMRGFSALNTLAAAVKQDDGAGQRNKSPSVVKAEPMEQPSLDELREDAGEADGEEMGPAPEPNHSPEVGEEVAQPESIRWKDPFAPKQTPSFEERKPSVVVDDVFGTDHDERPRQEPAVDTVAEHVPVPDRSETPDPEGDGEGEAAPGIVATADDELKENEVTLRILGSIYHHRPEAVVDAPALPVTPIAGDRPKFSGQSDASSTTISNEDMENTISRFDNGRLMTIIGEGENTKRGLDRKIREIGLDTLRFKSPFVPTLWNQLERAVDYQMNAYAWESGQALPPAELDTQAKREAYLVKVATSIITFRDQMPPETIQEIIRLKENTEHARWLAGRADSILEALMEERSGERIKALISPNGDGAGADGGQGGRGEVVYSDLPYQTTWKAIAPVVEDFRSHCVGARIPIFRTIQLMHRVEEGEEFDVIDTVIGDIKSPRTGDQRRRVIGIHFLVIPAGEWTMKEIESENQFDDRIALVGVGANAGRGLMIGDRKLRLFKDWCLKRGLEGSTILHVLPMEGASIDGHMDAMSIARAIQFGLPKGAPYKIRFRPWSNEDWDQKLLPLLK